MYIECTDRERMMLISALMTATRTKADEAIDAKENYEFCKEHGIQTENGAEDAPKEARRNFEVTAEMLMQIAEMLDRINPGNNGKTIEHAQNWIDYHRERINRNDKNLSLRQYERERG